MCPRAINNKSSPWQRISASPGRMGEKGKELLEAFSLAGMLGYRMAQGDFHNREEKNSLSRTRALRG
ncbi:Uncharacterised protein [Chlamydia trachomatis]|nr:Uncharacterised protein [Chlamydia trachomatis]